MSAPNMSGRTDAPTPDDHRDPSDLLTDDGSIDVSAVASVTNATARSKVTRAECRRIRERLAAEEISAADLAAELGYGHSTVIDHAAGECTHDHGAPPVAYDYSAGEWRVDR